ncbi:MAG: hypothetical protein V4720_01065 [Pseudomonadota bacterium]
MPRLLLVACLALAACGADGAPETPSKGIAVTGEAQVGVVIK